MKMMMKKKTVVSQDAVLLRLRLQLLLVEVLEEVLVAEDSLLPSKLAVEATLLQQPKTPVQQSVEMRVAVYLLPSRHVAGVAMARVEVVMVEVEGEGGIHAAVFWQLSPNVEVVEELLVLLHQLQQALVVGVLHHHHPLEAAVVYLVRLNRPLLHHHHHPHPVVVLAVTHHHLQEILGMHCWLQLLQGRRDEMNYMCENVLYMCV